MASMHHFLNMRGAYVRVRISNTQSPGLYAIDELERFQSNLSNSSPILLTSIQYRQRDIVSQMPCLDNIKVIYAYGQDFGEITIQGEILLGPLGDINTQGAQRVLDFFAEHRVSRKFGPVAVSAVSSTYLVYLTGIKMGAVDPELHIQPFSLFGTLWDANRETVGKLNPEGEVLTVDNAFTPAIEEALANNESDAPDLDIPQTGFSLIPELPDSAPAATDNAEDTGITAEDKQAASEQADIFISSNEPPVGPEGPAAKRLRRNMTGGGYASQSAGKGPLKGSIVPTLDQVLFNQSNPPDKQ